MDVNKEGRKRRGKGKRRRYCLELEVLEERKKLTEVDDDGRVSLTGNRRRRERANGKK